MPVPPCPRTDGGIGVVVGHTKFKVMVERRGSCAQPTYPICLRHVGEAGPEQVAPDLNGRTVFF
jgi:hypothetical protein